MRKTLIIDGKECHFKSSAAIPRIYRIKFKRDIFKDLTQINKQVKVQEKLKTEKKKECKEKGVPFDESEFESDLPINSLEMFENIAYVMHKHGDPSQPDDINEWLDQFRVFDIYQILPDIVEMWQVENTQMSTPKKANEK